MKSYFSSGIYFFHFRSYSNFPSLVLTHGKARVVSIGGEACQLKVSSAGQVVSPEPRLID